MKGVLVMTEPMMTSPRCPGPGWWTTGASSRPWGRDRDPKLGHVGAFGHEIAFDEVNQPLQGGQGQVGGPQVPILGHRHKKETSKSACRSHW